MARYTSSDLLNIDFDRATGETIYGWAAVSQGVREGLLTDFGTRIVREYYGSLVPRALGRNMSPELVLGLTASIAAHLDLFEPRFALLQIVPRTLSRLGVFEMELIGEYRPRALLGDDTGEGTRSFIAQLSRDGFGGEGFYYKPKDKTPVGAVRYQGEIVTYHGEIVTYA